MTIGTYTTRRAAGQLAAPLLLALAASACFVDGGPMGQDSTTGETDATTGEPGTTVGTTAGPTTDETSLTGATTEDATTGTGCPVGQEDCPCDALGSCEGELVCVADVCTATVPGGVCGDGEINDGEACDDGNEIDGDGCNSCELGGALLWQRTKGGSAGDADFAWAVAVDSTGNVYVAGHEVTLTQGINAWIGKYSPDGELAWDDSIDAGIMGDEYAFAVTVDENDNPVFAGIEPDSDGHTACWLRAHDTSTGAPLWGMKRPADLDVEVSFEDLVVDRDTGDVYVVGGLYDLQTFEPDALVLRFDPVGDAIVWERVLSANVMRPELATGVVLASNGDVIACGYFPNADNINDRDAWAVRIAPDQSEVWSQTFGSTNFDTGKDCALTPGGTLFFTSTQSLADPDEDPGSILGHVIYRVNPNTGVLNNSPILTELADAHGIAAGSDDTLALAGDVPVEGMGLDIWLRKYDALNNSLWTVTHNAMTGDSFDQAVSVAIDPDGNVIAAGGLGLINGGVDIWVGKFSP